MALVLVARLPPIHLPLATADALLFSYYIWKSIREVLFALHILYLNTFTVSGHVAELNEWLGTVLRRQSTLPMLKYRHLDLFYGEYRRLLAQARYANAQVVSPVMAATVATQLALNLLATGFLLFRRLYPGEQLLLVAFAAIQFLLATGACLGLTTWSEVFNRSSALLYRAQLVQLCGGGGGGGGRRSWNEVGEGSQQQQQHQQQQQQQQQLYRRALLITAKLKLMVFFEQVCRRRGDEFRFTVGSLAKISRRSLYEFAFLYSSLVMYVAKMIHRGRLGKD